MRNGLKVYDSDTHVHASAEGLEPYLSASVRKLSAGTREVPPAHEKDNRRGCAGAALLPPL